MYLYILDVEMLIYLTRIMTLHLKHAFFSDNGSATKCRKWRAEKRRQGNKTASVPAVTITQVQRQIYSTSKDKRNSRD